MNRFQGTVVIADTETTDKDIETAGICQLAAVAMTQEKDMSWKISPMFQTYCSPSEPMKPEALAVHNITPELYQYAPTDAFALWALSAVIDKLPKPVILSGYNCTRFDYPLMQKVYAGGYVAMPQIDVMTLYLRLAPEKGLKLTEVFQEEINDQNLMNSAHDAMADCWMTALVLQKYLERYPTDPEILAQWCNTAVAMETMPWGKYKGRPFDDVPRSYLEWMVNKWDDMHPDLALSMRNKGLM